MNRPLTTRYQDIFRILEKEADAETFEALQGDWKFFKAMVENWLRLLKEDPKGPLEAASSITLIESKPRQKTLRFVYTPKNSMELPISHVIVLEYNEDMTKIVRRRHF